MVQLEEGIASGVANDRRIQPTYGYYRQPNGWITVSPITRMERIKYVEEGWEHLARYGAFDMSPYVAAHPFEALFMFGGVGEMPAEQVIQMGLYLDPPRVPTCRQQLTQFHRGHTPDCWQGASRVQFPQLADVDQAQLGPFPCAFCERQMATIQAREQHQMVAHKDALGNLQTGRSLGASLADALKKTGAQEASREDLQRELSLLQLQVKELREASMPRAKK